MTIERVTPNSTNLNNLDISKKKTSGNTSGNSDVSIWQNSQKTSTEQTLSTNNTDKKTQEELSSLGLVNRDGEGEKIKSAGGKEYTVVGNADSGRKIVKDSNGTLQVMSHDNKILKKDYVIKSNKDKAIRTNSTTAHNSTLEILNNNLKSAQTAFEKQMAEDGWAGDLADGISVLWGSDNRATKVEKDLKTYNKNIEQLKKAAAQGDANFNTQFKKMFNVEYNQNAIADYVKNPTQKNYGKAFGTQNNIQDRVAKYNESQQTGAAAVKTTATIGAGIAVGVATGGTGLAAMGVAAGATAASSAAINTSDRLSSDVGLKDGELTEIAKNAAWDGASVLAGGAVGKAASTLVKGAGKAAITGRAAINTSGDIAMGAAQEYAETGSVSAGGIAANAALGTIGLGVETGAFKKTKNLISGEPATPNTPKMSLNESASTAPADIKQKNEQAAQQTQINIKPEVETPNQTSQTQSSAEIKPQTEVKPQAESKPSGVSAESQQKETAPEKHNFVQDVLSNKKESETALKSADLSDSNVMKKYTDMFAESFPAMKNYPKKGQIIKQYQDLISHPDYSKLSDANKTIAKMCILKNSDIYPEDIANAFKVNKYTLKRMEDMSSLVNAETNPKAVAALYNKGDYDAFKILNEIKSGRKISPETISQMDTYNQTAQSRGNLLVKQSHITSPKDIPTKTLTKNGSEYNIPVLDLTDENILANLDKYGFEQGTTTDNLKLTVHMNDDFNKHPRVIGRLINTTDVSYSATITDGTNHLYGDMQVGVFLDYKQGAVSYASNYAAGTGFGKNRASFAEAKLGTDGNEHANFVRDRFIERMQEKGADINTDDYAQISNMFSGKNMTTAQLENIAEDGFVNINNKKFSIDEINEALDGSSNDLINMNAELTDGISFKKGFNEINVFNGDIKGIYVRANNATETIEDIVSEDMLKWIQQRNLPILFQRYDLTKT